MSEYTVSDYLLDRLAELSVGHVFGVPGDFTLGLLDHVIAHPSVSWVGCTNELNAGYAADGYARMRGIGALMTTFGVGELSAINAVAGSYAEHVPVVHVVGSPSVAAQAAQRMVHHSLGDGVFTHFMQMHEQITCARAALTGDNARDEIDRVLIQTRDRKLPGYLLLPSDVAELPTSPPPTPLPAPHDITDPDTLAEFRAAAEQLLTAAHDTGDVSVLAGLLVHRFAAADALRRLLILGTPHATTAWSKSLVDETDPAFLGLYAGGLSAPAVRQVIEDAPCLIVAGIQFTDLNSGFFTHQITRGRTIELGATTASVGDEVFDHITIGAALDTLADLVSHLPSRPLQAPHTIEHPPTSSATSSATSPSTDSALTQAGLWDAVAGFLHPGDVVLADQGTSFYGMATTRLPSDVAFIGQPLWASIGYTVPALLGAVLASARRGVLLVGDGAAQMTATEIATVLRHRLPVVIVVVDNAGYTVERAIHGPDQPYNDIPTWDWAALPAVLGLDQPSATYCVHTDRELIAALSQARTTIDRASLIQAVVPPLDVPVLLADLARAAAAANSAVSNSAANAPVNAAGG